MVHNSNCLLCKSSEIRLLHACTDHLVTREDFEVYSCMNCGFVFTMDYPVETEAGKYYDSDDYISHTGSNRNILESLYNLARKLMLSRKRNILKRSCGTSGLSILDIGSGTGHFLDLMKRSGWEVTGIEISPKAREFSAMNFGINALPPEKTESLPTRSFDCITFWHSLEHVYDLHGMFSGIKRVLKPGGSVIVALPNNSSWDANHYGKDWAAWDVPRHLWHFTPRSFSLLAGISGFKITGIIPLPFDVFYISILSEKYRGSKIPYIAGFVKGFVFSVLSAFTIRRSSSLVYILKSTKD